MTDTERGICGVRGHADVFTDRLADRLRAARDRGVDVILGAETDEERAVLQDAIPDSDVFVTGLDWLSASDLPGDETEISRLLMTDHEAILVSSFTDDDAGRSHERGVFGRGFDNGLVAIVRRLMTTGLLLGDDPAKNAS